METTKAASTAYNGPKSAVAGSAGLIGALVAAAVTQALNSTTDHAHLLSRVANQNLFGKEDGGLPYGPYSPLHGKTP